MKSFREMRGSETENYVDINAIKHSLDQQSNADIGDFGSSRTLVVPPSHTLASVIDVFANTDHFYTSSKSDGSNLGQTLLLKNGLSFEYVIIYT